MDQNNCEPCEKCKYHSDMTLIGSKKLGHELIDLYECNWCSKIFEKIGSYKVKNEQNHKISDTNLCMYVSIFKAGTNTSKIDEFFISVCFIDPVKSKLHENYQKLKPFIMDLSKL